jgi:hypothetical protein
MSGGKSYSSGPGHGSQRRASVAATAGASPHTQRGNASLFDGGKAGFTDAKIADVLWKGLPKINEN